LHRPNCHGSERERDTAPDVSIIVPTYQEAGNLRLLVPRIASAMQPTGRSYEVLILDDNSDDLPDEVVRGLAERSPVELVVRTGPRDLSLAVLEGLRRARGRSLLVMDADMSHPPEAIPDLLTTLDSPGVDFVIGSRFAPGGRTEDWGGRRRLNSYVAGLLCRPLTGSVRDPMAGFFALHRATFERVEGFDPVGYKIGLELLCRCRCRHVVEVPITFANRTSGQPEQANAGSAEPVSDPPRPPVPLVPTGLGACDAAHPLGLVRRPVAPSAARGPLRAALIRVSGSVRGVRSCSSSHPR